MNKWGIPREIEELALQRDQRCVYCSVHFDVNSENRSHKTRASWEHVINDITIITPKNIVRCCTPCNSSKGIKSLGEWFSTPYCLKNGINQNTVAEIIRLHIGRYCRDEE